MKCPDLDWARVTGPIRVVLGPQEQMVVVKPETESLRCRYVELPEMGADAFRAVLAFMYYGELMAALTAYTDANGEKLGRTW